MSTEELPGHPGGFQAELAGLLLSEETVSGLLEIVVDLAATAIDGVAGASVSQVMGEGDRVETTSASSETVRTVDEAQYKDKEGPCVEAIKTGDEVTITIPCDRWPTFSGAAQAAGLRSVLSLPLRVSDRTTGALNLYSSGAEPIGGSQADAARVLARQAAVVLANVAALSSAELANRQLEEALASRDLIGQAKGILMAREGVTADEAFDLLRRLSQRTGRKLRDVAGEVAANPTG